MVGKSCEVNEYVLMSLFGTSGYTVLMTLNLIEQADKFSNTRESGFSMETRKCLHSQLDPRIYCCLIGFIARLYSSLQYLRGNATENEVYSGTNKGVLISYQGVLVSYVIWDREVYRSPT